MAARAAIPPAGATATISEDVYLRLMDENRALKQTAHEAQDALRRVQTKLLMVEETLRRAADGTALQKLVLAERRIAELEEDNETLARKNHVLADKLRLAEEALRVRAKVHGTALPPGRVPRPGSAMTSPGVLARGRPSTAARRPSSATGPSPSRSRSRSRSGEGKVAETKSPGDQRAGGGVGAGAAASGASSPRSAAASELDGAVGMGGMASRDSEIASLKRQITGLMGQLTSVTTDNSALRSQLATALIASGTPAGGAGSAAPTPARSGPFLSSAPQVAVPHGDLVEFERQLRDKSAQVLLLKSRYEHLEAKTAAERELYDRAMKALEDQNVELRATRAAMQSLEAEVASQRARLRDSDTRDAELRKAREDLRNLETALTELAESPFVRPDGAGSGSSLVKDALTQRQRLEQLEASDKTLRETVAQLQHTVRSQALELQSVAREKRDLADAHDRMRDEFERLKATADGTLRANTMLRERLALYSGGAGLDSTGAVVGDPLAIPPDELARALAIVRRRIDRPSNAGAEFGALVGTSGATDDASVPALQRRVQQLQVALLTAQGELDRYERMVKAQTTISADLSAEVTDLHGRLGRDTTTLKRTLAETEATAEQRLQRIHLLEAQVAQLLRQAKAAVQSSSRRSGRQRRGQQAALGTIPETDAGRDRRRGEEDSTVISDVSEDAARGLPGGGGDGDDDSAITPVPASELEGGGRGGRRHHDGDSDGSDDEEIGEDSSGSLSSSLLSEMYDVTPGETRLEVFVRGGIIDPAALGRHTTTFAMVDFYNFETQMTPVATGPTPAYNSSSLFTFKVEEAALRYLATECLVVEINRARGADFDQLGRVTLPLHTLLTAGGHGAGAGSSSLARGPHIRVKAAPIRGRDGRPIGSLHVEMRLSVGLGEAWAALCRDKPNETAALTALMKRRDAAAAEGVADAGMLLGSAASTSAIAGLSSGPSGTGSRPMNELIVTVVAAAGLRSRALSGAPAMAGLPPNAYVQYILPLPGAATAFTPLVPRSYDPLFADTRAFPLVPSAGLLSTLASAPLHFIVCDDSVAVNPESDFAAPAPPSRTLGGGGALAQADLAAGISRATRMAAGGSHRAVLGVATVSLSRVAEGLEQEGTYEVVDERGARVGSLTVRIMWARPLITTDGAPPDSLTKPQFHALAAVVDRDGGGVKWRLLAHLLTASEAEYAALERVRDAIAVHMREARVSEVLFPARASDLLPSGGGGAGAATAGSTYAGGTLAPRRTWSQALIAAAEVAGRVGSRVTPREAYDALASATVNVAVDLPTVEDAVLCLMGDNDGSIEVGDVIDAFMPLNAISAIAMAKARRWAAGLVARQGPGYLHGAFKRAIAATITTAASGASAGSAPDAAMTLVAAVPPRISRTSLALLLNDLGLLVVEDSLPRAFASFAATGTVGGRSFVGGGGGAPPAGVIAAPPTEEELLYPISIRGMPVSQPSGGGGGGADPLARFAQSGVSIPARMHGAAAAMAGPTVSMDQYGAPYLTSMGAGAGSGAPTPAAPSSLLTGGHRGSATGAPSTRISASEMMFDLLAAADRLTLSSAANIAARTAAHTLPGSGASSAPATALGSGISTPVSGISRGSEGIVVAAPAPAPAPRPDVPTGPTAPSRGVPPLIAEPAAAAASAVDAVAAAGGSTADSARRRRSTRQLLHGGDGAAATSLAASTARSIEAAAPAATPAPAAAPAAAAAAAGAAPAISATAAAAGGGGGPVPPRRDSGAGIAATASAGDSSAAAAAARRRSSGAMPSAASGAAVTTPRPAADWVVSVAARLPDTDAAPALSIEVVSVARLHTQLARLLQAHASAVSRRAREALLPWPVATTAAGAATWSAQWRPHVFLSYTFPVRRLAVPAAATASGDIAATSLVPITVVLAAQLDHRRGDPRSFTLNAFYPAELWGDAGGQAPHWPMLGGGRGGARYGTATSFPLAPAGRTWTPQRVLAQYLADVLAPDATPEDADLTFALSLLPPVWVAPTADVAVAASPSGGDDASAHAAFAASVIATATFTLHDLASARGDVEAQQLPLTANGDNCAALAKRYEADLSALASGADAAGAGAGAGAGTAAGAVADVLRRSPVVGDLGVSMGGQAALSRLLSRGSA